jgi:hypothetical protein
MPEPKTTMPVNLAPKARFQNIARAVGDHRAMMETPQFHRAIDYAEAEYVHTLCELAPKDVDSSSNLQASAACFQRILGMHEFIGVLKKLAEPRPAIKPSPSGDNLEHNLK